MAAPQSQIVVWIGLNERNEVVRVEKGDRTEVAFRVLETQDMSVPFSAVASLSGCRPECVFCYNCGGRLCCICRC